MRTWYPIEDNSITVRADVDGRIYLVIGRATINLTQAEANAIADSLTRAAAAAPASAGGGLPA